MATTCVRLMILALKKAVFVMEDSRDSRVSSWQMKASTMHEQQVSSLCINSYWYFTFTP